MSFVSHMTPQIHYHSTKEGPPPLLPMEANVSAHAWRLFSQLSSPKQLCQATRRQEVHRHFVDTLYEALGFRYNILKSLYALISIHTDVSSKMRAAFDSSHLLFALLPLYGVIYVFFPSL